MVKTYVSGDFSTNTYVLSKNDECVIIDPTLDLEDIVKEIKKSFKIKAVLITHAHIDHIDGLRYLTDYPIYISKEDYSHLLDGGYTLYGWYSMKLPFDISKMNFHLLENNDTINILDEPIKCMITSGHTLGGMCFSYKDILFTGDTLFKGSVGRTDLPGGNEMEILKSIKKIIETYNDNTVIYPGHDRSSTIRDERKYNMYYDIALKRCK